METLRIATWNMRAAFPKLKGPTKTEEMWKWAHTNLAADIYVFTEAKIPETGIPNGWNAVWVEGGIGGRRPWGTIIASPTLELQRSEFVSNPDNDPEYEHPVPATTECVDVVIDGEVWGTVVGVYGFLLDGKSGGDALFGISCKITDALLAHDLPLIVAGDFNLHPTHVLELFDVIHMKDVIAIDGSRKERADGVGGTRVWTHKNTDDPNKNASIQELDFIFATEDLWDELIDVRAGIEDFPDAWTVSDHAPVVAEFRIQN
jgi:hypothetical protein